MGQHLFHEQQKFQQWRSRIFTAIPPLSMLALVIWQVMLGHQWGSKPMSNTGLVLLTIFLWLIYYRLVTLKLVTDVQPGEVRVSIPGLWRTSRISAAGVRSVEVVSYRPLDWGGYGMRQTKRGRAYIASGNEAVRLTMADGKIVLLGSQRASDLAGAIRAAQ